MTTYRALPDNLKSLADATQYYLTNELGLNSINIEKEIDRNIDFRPTLSATSTDKHIICAEVVDRLLTPDIEHFILACRNHSLPVKPYIVVLQGSFSAYPQHALKFARENGVAILEISPPSHGQLITALPLALSLSGLRKFETQSFPKKYREPLKQAIETFKNGNPVKGCSEVYDEIEQLTRRIGKKCATIPGGLKQTTSYDWDKEAWSKILDFMNKQIDRSAIQCPLLNNQLFSRLIGMTEFRNETGHKPASLTKRVERDKQLRTRFESAVDELKLWIEASKALKV